MKKGLTIFQSIDETEIVIAMDFSVGLVLKPHSLHICRFDFLGDFFDLLIRFFIPSWRVLLLSFHHDIASSNNREKLYTFYSDLDYRLGVSSQSHPYYLSHINLFPADFSESPCLSQAPHKFSSFRYAVSRSYTL